jgi:erythrocyte band 7 integral membrane protein
MQNFGKLSTTINTSANMNAKHIARTIFKIVPQHMRGIKYGFGKYVGDSTPGINLNLPIYHKIYLLDIRSKVESVPNMKLISSDNITFEVSASMEYNISDCKKAILNVSDVNNAVLERCKMELRNKLSSMTVNEILQNKTEINKSVLAALSPTMSEWGVDIKAVQIKDIKFDESMKQAMSTVAEATRQAEAKIINAKADIETAKQYSEAAKIYSENPLTVRLREFQLWHSVSKNPSNTIYVVPSDLLASNSNIHDLIAKVK